MRWSIRTKILIVLSSLLLVVVSAYLILAEKILREDKELLVLDTNRSNTEQLANELDGSLRRIVDKMEILAELVLNKANLTQSSEKSLAETFFEKDRDLLVFQLILPSRRTHPIMGELVSQRKLQKASVSLDQIRDPNILPLVIQTSQKSIEVENRSISSTILYLIRVPVKISGTKAEPPLYAQALIDGRSWENTFRDSQTLALNFVVTSNGEVFAHPDSSWVVSRKNLSNLEIVKQSHSQNFITQQIEFDFEKTSYLGVYRNTALGALTVISMIDKGTARLASRLLFEKTMILSLIIVTTVLLISLFFSGSLIRPLLSLVEATRQIAQGNFDTPIEIQTRDEIGVLASAFSQMVKELKSSRLLLEEYNRGLELKVQERTQELEDKNVAIRQQQEAMLKSARLATVGEIAGQAAHEVLNPLTAMISNLENLINKVNEFRIKPSAPIPVFNAILAAWNRTYKSGGSRAWLADVQQPSLVFPGKSLVEEDIENLTSIFEHLEVFTRRLKTDLAIILGESHRVGRIVDRMRGLSRLSRFPSRLEINSLISDCVRVIEDLLARFQIKIETHYEKLPIHIKADKDEMWQVFSNLIKNSMDAIQEHRRLLENSKEYLRESKIRITTRVSHGQVIISFWDNGIGVSSTNQDRVFETNFSTKGADGTGLGLGICRRFIRESGGEIILAESKPGQFTEFQITFPQLPMENLISQKENHVTD